jgi:LacI family transcriptional regulator
MPLTVKTDASYDAVALGEIDMLAVHSLELVLGRMQGRLRAAPRTIEVNADFMPRSSCSPLTLSPIK